MTVPPRRDQAGSVTPLIIGFAVVVALVVAVVVDASAAYLRRSGLDSVADAAALAATDGLQGDAVYRHGLGARVPIDPQSARAYVAAYLRDSGAWRRYPGLVYAVQTQGQVIVVRVAAPLTLPLHVAGVGERTIVRATAASSVVVSG